jgi:RNA polymerase sigma-70 factor (ECF subfamily)
MTGRASLSGDPESFARQYEAYVDAVFNYCLFRLGDWMTAEDVTADVFERAWRNRRHYRPEQAGFTTWLFAIARNAVIDHQRRAQRRPLVALNESHPDGKSLPERLVEDAERLAHLRGLIQSLPEHDRELIALKFGAGLTNRHIASLLGKQESAVGSTLHRIIQKLRQQWEIPHVDYEEQTNG